jgi:hypothetical protein
MRVIRDHGGGEGAGPLKRELAAMQDARGSRKSSSSRLVPRPLACCRGRAERASWSDLGRCECQHDRQRQKHRARLVVTVGENLLLRQLDVPSRQDLVALEALANTGQGLIEFRAVGSEKADGEEQSGSELLRIPAAK